MSDQSKFNITSSRSFQMLFENGWIISIQWNPPIAAKTAINFKCENAEVEIHHSSMEGFLEYPKTKPTEMAKIMAIVANFHPEFIYSMNLARSAINSAM